MPRNRFIFCNLSNFWLTVVQICALWSFLLVVFVIFLLSFPSFSLSDQSSHSFWSVYKFCTNLSTQLSVSLTFLVFLLFSSVICNIRNTPLILLILDSLCVCLSLGLPPCSILSSLKCKCVAWELSELYISLCHF